MKTTKMTFKAENFSKPTPRILKMIGDIAIYTLPAWQGAIMASPLDPDFKLWSVFAISMVLPLVKGVTKFFTYEEIKN